MRHFQTSRLFTAMLLILVSGSALCADETSPSVAGIEKLAHDLKHQDYAVRDAATRKLSSLGPSVIAPVTEIALQDNLEAGLRAVAILETLYLSEDAVAFDQAEVSLNQLISQSKLPAVAQKATQTLEANRFTVTQRRAIAEVRRLGGQIQMQREIPILVNGEHIRPEQGWAQAAAIDRHWMGGVDGLRHLSRLKSLIKIYLVSGHPLPNEAIEDLKVEMPDTEFEPRGPAMLGVAMGVPGPLGCTISKVSPGGAADNAGMLTGDIVVEIDGKPVRQPEDLIRIVGEHREDQELEIIVLRGDPILKYGLFEMLHQPEQFSPILAIAIMSQMRTKFTVSLGEWSIDG
jgi:hypothetical protein